MPTYSTVAGAKAAKGGGTNLVSRTGLAGAAADAEIGDLLNAAEATINAALSAAGWTVPIVVADVTTDADLQAQISALLERKAYALMFGLYLAGSDLTQREKDAMAACRDLLDLLAAAGSLGGVTASPSPVTPALAYRDGTARRLAFKESQFRDMRACIR